MLRWPCGFKQQLLDKNEITIDGWLKELYTALKSQLLFRLQSAAVIHSCRIIDEINKYKIS